MTLLLINIFVIILFIIFTVILRTISMSLFDELSRKIDVIYELPINHQKSVYQSYSSIVGY